MTLSFRYRGFAQSSRLALAVALAIPAAVALPVEVQAQEAQQDYNIAEGDLGGALQRYSAATGVQLVYSSDLVAGKRSSGVSGRMSPQQALGQLLAGTGLSARVQGNTATLVRAGAPGVVAAAEGERLLGPVRVEGSQDAYSAPVRGDGIAQIGGIRGEQDEEVIGYRPRVASVATGVPVPVEDIPRSISIQTQDQIEKQDITTIGDSLKRLSGVTVIESGAVDSSIFVRGYELDSFSVDGGAARPLSIAGNGLLGIDAYERVELVRGPNALFSGEGSVGGTLNLVRKRPGSVARQEISLQVGSFGRLAAVADISTPGVVGSIAFRGVASVRRDGSPVNDYSTVNKTLYGILDAPLGDNARLEFGFNLNRVDVDGEYQGQSRSVQGTLFDVSPSYNVTTPGAYRTTETSEIFSALYVDLASNWDLELSGFYQKQKDAGIARSTGGYFNEDGSLFAADIFGPAYQSVQRISVASPNVLGLSAKLTGRFETFGLTHNVFAGLTRTMHSAGGSRQSEPLLIAFANSFAEMQKPLWGPVPDGQAPFASTGGFSTTDTTTSAIILGDTISWRDIISAGITMRRDQVNISSIQATFSDGELVNLSLSPPPAKATWRPSFSLNVRPFEGLSLYGSYADGFTRQDNVYSRSGEAPNFTYSSLPPSTFKNKEVGVKFARNKWLASLSAYQLDTTGLAVFLDVPFSCPPNFNSPCFEPGGQDVRNTGIDAEINGEIAKGLSVVASFNYSAVKKAPTSSYLEITQAPQTSGNFYADWRPTFAPDISLQLGARYRGKYFEKGERYLLAPDGTFQFESEPYEVREKAYLVFDLGVEYAFRDGLTFGVFVENLADKKYLSTVNSGVSSGNFYGRPRSFLATLRWKRATDRAPSLSGGNAPFGKASDWYAAFDAGFLRAGDLTATAAGKAQDQTSPVAWEFDIQSREAFGGRIGYKVTDNLRVEIEGQYKPAAVRSIGGNAVAPFGVCDATDTASGVPFNCDELRGRSDQLTLGLNAVYEFGSRSLRPFIGGGIGITRHTMAFSGKMDGIGGDAPWQFCIPGLCLPILDRQRLIAESIGSADTSNRFQYQAIAGLTYKLADRISVDLTYRYMDSKLKWQSFNLDGPGFNGQLPLTPRLGNFKAGSQSHMLTLGLRWAFGSTR